ncbi:MAG: hypothetical protein LBV28_04640, partial [Puniceicoccales bacterium]|nr:hypothetical protein [Puniceicoccales bacterium]
MRNTLPKRFLKTLATALLLPVATVPFALAADTTDATAPKAATAPAPATAPVAIGTTEEATVLENVSVESAGIEKSALSTRPNTSLYGFAETIRDVPRSVFQISKAQLDTDNIRNFTDFSRYSPSIRRGTTTTYSVANLRGSTADTARNGTVLFNPALRPFDNNAWESVDIVPGVPSVSQGGTARTAGYVNYITKQPFFDGEHTSLAFQFGRAGLTPETSYGQYSAQIDHSRVLIKDVLAVRFSLQRSEADQYWAGSAADFKDVYAAITWKPTKNLTIDANLTYLASEGAIPWGINRVDQALISDWTYRTGEYVPRITWHSANYTYNPALAGYTQGANFIPLGSEPWSQSDPGRIGFVAPAGGLTRVPIEGHQVVEGKLGPNNIASEYIAQAISTL